jgi:hypothetical protein
MMTGDGRALSVRYARQAAARAAEAASDAAELAAAGQLCEALRTANEAVRHLESMKRLLQEAETESSPEEGSNHA